MWDGDHRLVDLLEGRLGARERLDRLGSGAKGLEEEREVAAPQLGHDRAGAIDQRRQHQLQDAEILRSRVGPQHAGIVCAPDHS